MLKWLKNGLRYSQINEFLLGKFPFLGLSYNFKFIKE